MACNRICWKREVHSDKCLHDETRKSMNKPNLTPQGTRKRKKMKPKVSRRKEITKIGAE